METQSNSPSIAGKIEGETHGPPSKPPGTLPEPSANGGGPSSFTIGDKLETYEAFRSYARHEDNLINNRMTWMLTIHGFLYASYGFTLQKKLEILEKLKPRFVIWGEATNLPLHEYPLPFRQTLFEIEAFLGLIAVIGFLISLYAWLSVRAAKSAIVTLKRTYEKEHLGFPDDPERKFIELNDRPKLVLPPLAGGGEKYAHEVGHSASMTIPLFLMGSWTIAFVGTVFFVVSNNALKWL